MSQSISFVVNGRAVESGASGSTSLLLVLRNELGLSGARFGCGEGHCGACTVNVAGRAVTTCDLPLEAVHGKSVETIEGIGGEGKLHRVQQALLDEQAGQCGYCLAGIVMRAKALLDANPSPTHEQIILALDQHLCRCGAQPRILRAIRRAAAG